MNDHEGGILPSGKKAPGRRHYLCLASWQLGRWDDLEFGILDLGFGMIWEEAPGRHRYLCLVLSSKLAAWQMG